MRLSGIYVIFGQLAVAVVPLILTPYVTRTLGAEGVGLYSLSFSVASVFLIVGQLGAQLYGRREIAKCGDDRILRSRVFWGIFGLLIKSNMAVMAVYSLAVSVVPMDTRLRAALWVQLILLFSGAINIAWLLHGVERFKLVSLGIVISRLVLLLAVPLTIKSPSHELAYVALMAGAFLLGSTFPWLIAPKLVERPNWGDLRTYSHLRPLRHFLVSAVALQFLNVVNVYVIGWLRSVQEVGWYDIAFRLARAPVPFIEVVAIVLLPRVSRMMARGNDKAARSYLKQGMALTIFLGAGLAMAIAGTAGYFIPWYAGASFNESTGALQILAISLCIIGWGNVIRNQVLLPNGADGVYSLSLVLGFVANAILAAFLVPLDGVRGAGLAFVLAEVIAVAYQTLHARRYCQLMPLIQVAMRYVFPAVVGLLAMTLLAEGTAPLLGMATQLLVGGAVYCALVATVEHVTSSQIVIAEGRRLAARIAGR